MLLIAPLRRWLAGAIGGAVTSRRAQQPGVVDLDPEEWRQVPDRELSDRRLSREQRDDLGP
jgi:hypothetical protein